VDTLSLWFDIDPSSVVRVIYKLVPELWRYLWNQIRWPNLHEWANLMGNWPELPNAVGAIDTTPHEIYRPLTKPQRPFYSGYRHYHCMNAQLVMENEGQIRFVQPGRMMRFLFSYWNLLARGATWISCLMQSFWPQLFKRWIALSTG